MNELEIKNATIKSAEISYCDRGHLDCWVHLDYGNSGQGFGGWALYLPETYTHHNVMSVAGHHIFRVMEVAGVTKWSDLVGQTVRVECDWSHVTRIGHITKDDWYCPSEDFEAARALQNNPL